MRLDMVIRELEEIGRSFKAWDMDVKVVGAISTDRNTLDIKKVSFDVDRGRVEVEVDD